MLHLAQRVGSDPHAELGTSDAIRALRSRSVQGRKSHELGARVLALETIETVDIPSPLYLSAGSGPFVWDADGIKYVDLTMGFGAHVLGHRPAPVEAALMQQVGTGWHYGLSNTIQVEFADELLDATHGMQKVLFAASGTEATMYAMRAARAFTGRDKIVVFDGSYHGSHDYAVIKADPQSPRERPRAMSLGSGIPSVIRDRTMIVAPYMNTSAFDVIRAHAKQAAAVLVQPVQNNLPTLSGGWFLEGLRSVCDEIGAILIFDEVVTAFRIAIGGGQERFGVTPDLAAYGKAIGGGLPIGALAGRGEIMELFARANRIGGIFAGGTFNANPLSMSAGLAAMRFMKRNAGTIYPYLETQGDRLAGEINRFCRMHQFEVQFMNAGSMMCVHFQSGDIKSSRDFRQANKDAVDAFFFQMLARGVVMPANRLIFISSAHEPSHIDLIIEAVKGSLLAIRRDGLF